MLEQCYLFEEHFLPLDTKNGWPIIPAIDSPMSGDSERAPLSKRAFRETNLFDPWSAEGKPNELHMRAIRLLDSHLSKYSWYVGVSCWGSTFFGFSTSAVDDFGRPISDVDLYVLVDTDNKQENNKISRAIITAREEVEKTLGWDDILRGTRVNVRHEKERALFALSFWATQARGDGKVAHWRNEYKSYCASLQPNERQRVKKQLVKQLMAYVDVREAKMETRIEGYGDATDEDKIRMARSRETMWNERVFDIFGL